MVSAHAMYAASRRCRRGAKVEVFRRSPIRIERQNRTHQELPEVIGSAADVSAHQICVRVFKLRRVFGVAGQHQVAKAGANRSTCASMASVMSNVDPFGTWQYAQAVCRPAGARVGSKRLGCASSTKGACAVFAVPGRCFSRLDLFEGAAKVQRPGARALRIAPGDRTIERPIDLEHARAICEPAQTAGRNLAEGAWRRFSALGEASNQGARRAPEAGSSMASTGELASIVPPSDRR